MTARGFAEDLAGLRRTMLSADPTNRLAVFGALARELVNHSDSGMPKPDITDALKELAMTFDGLDEFDIEAKIGEAFANPFKPVKPNGASATPLPEIKPLPLDEFLKLNVSPRALLLGPVFPEKGLYMLYAPRGMGKTFLALAMAYATAAGGSVARWKAPAPRRVLYIDGEMPLATIQERLVALAAGSDEKPLSENLLILAADYFPEGLPNLATPAGQAVIETMLEGVDFMVIDNISTLATSGHDNDAESWTPVQGWLLKLRRRGISVLLVHHAAKGGQQRGTSRREDVLDTVVALRHPSDYSASEGARFNVHIEKARGAYGDDVKPFEAKLEIINGGAEWSTRDLVDADLQRVIALANDGLSVRDIAEEAGLSKSAVHRLKKKAEAAGGVFPKAQS